MKRFMVCWMAFVAMSVVMSNANAQGTAPAAQGATRAKTTNLHLDVLLHQEKAAVKADSVRITILRCDDQGSHCGLFLTLASASKGKSKSADDGVALQEIVAVPLEWKGKRCSYRIYPYQFDSRRPAEKALYETGIEWKYGIGSEEATSVRASANVYAEESGIAIPSNAPRDVYVKAVGALRPTPMVQKKVAPVSSTSPTAKGAPLKPTGARPAAPGVR